MSYNNDRTEAWITTMWTWQRVTIYEHGNSFSFPYLLFIFVFSLIIKETWNVTNTISVETMFRNGKVVVELPKCIDSPCKPSRQWYHTCEKNEEDDSWARKYMTDVMEVQTDPHHSLSCFWNIWNTIPNQEWSSQKWVTVMFYDDKSLHKSKKLVLHIFTIHFPLNSFQITLLQNLPNTE